MYITGKERFIYFKKLATTQSTLDTLHHVRMNYFSKEMYKSTKVVQIFHGPANRN